MPSNVTCPYCNGAIDLRSRTGSAAIVTVACEHCFEDVAVNQYKSTVVEEKA